MEDADSYYDGDFTAPVAVSPVSVSYPLQPRGDYRTRVVTQRFWVLARSYQGPTLGAIFYDKTQVSMHRQLKMVGHSTPTPIDGGLVEFEAMWAECPGKRIESQVVTYTYQFTRESDGETQLGEVTKSVSSILVTSYIETSNPATILTRSALRYTRFPSAILAQGGNSRSSHWTLTNREDYILASDTTFDRWLGNFYWVEERFVPNLTIGESLS